MILLVELSYIVSPKDVFMFSWRSGIGSTMHERAHAFNLTNDMQASSVDSTHAVTLTQRTCMLVLSRAQFAGVRARVRDYRADVLACVLAC